MSDDDLPDVEELEAEIDRLTMALEEEQELHSEAKAENARLRAENANQAERIAVYDDTLTAKRDHEVEHLRAVVEAAKALLDLHDDGRLVSAMLDAKDYAELNSYGIRLHDATEELRSALKRLEAT